MSIKFYPETKTFFLDGKNITYAFRINEANYAEHCHFGEKIGHDDLSYAKMAGATTMFASVSGCSQSPMLCYNYYPSELTFFGTGDYREPTVHVENAAGDRLTELLYEGHEIVPTKPAMKGMPSMRGGETLIVHLKDKYTDFAADLYYTVYDDCAAVARRIVYKNCGKTPVILRRAYSFCFTLHDQNYNVMSLHGAWATERMMQETSLHKGVISIDSKMASSSAKLNPFIGLIGKETTEESGDAYGVTLVYSSSYVLKAEGVGDDRTLVMGGINDFDFSWTLEAGEEFETPEAILVYSNHGVGGMSREFHDAMREHLINPRFVKKSRPLVINNWEGTYFNFTTEKLKAIADAAVGTGIDTFVLDDGWFGKRDDDFSGLGDWYVNEKKLEGGLDAIIDHVHSLGMKFGLWFEPEMVNEDSDLYRAHPDYAITAPSGRPHCYARHQLVLDLTREDVRDYIVNAVNGILKKHKIEYVKWDCNRSVTAFWSEGRDASRQAEFAHRYALGLYDIFERIVNGNPDVFFEGCSSGGARFDAGVLYYFPQIWTSDDTDADMRTSIQYGTSILYPQSAMSAHVSAVPNHQTRRTTTMATRAAIAHLCATGYELDTTTLTDEDKALVREYNEEYKNNMEALVLEGDLYRSENPMTSMYFAETLVSKDRSRAVLTFYRRLRLPNPPTKHIRPAGLDPEKKYLVKEKGVVAKGSTLMKLGFPAVFPDGDFSVIKLHYEEVK